ncbi:type II toxin-antitoxin system antitoxin SocA domain-containing protein [Chryseobacterium sp. 22543]|uniref:type II toxin-antitoxin system antitoxin SocA domain-containing protein n=1 Tax=Chryseobacterium sp. 22543 TaxID=3453940 RepID=UPI003F8511AE
MDTNKLLITKYILYKFSIWYKEAYGESENNDLSILKSLKLVFLLATINSKKQNENLLDMGFEFTAMPYGPVEKEIYDSYKEGLLNDIIDKNGLKIHNLQEIVNNKALQQKDKDLIDNNLGILKSYNYYLISKSASYLVDLTHKFTSWKKNYKLATSVSKYSHDIPKIDIQEDLLHYSL